MKSSIKRRPIRVATVSHRPQHGTDTPENTQRLLGVTSNMIERAARLGADLVAFPEIYPQLAIHDAFHHAEPSASGTLDRIRELARSHRLYIVWPRVECDADRGLRNTSILVDRTGEVVGRYDKMFPTVGELEKGVIPGAKVPSSKPTSGAWGS
jgi:predicted amidohydrolase